MYIFVLYILYIFEFNNIRLIDSYHMRLLHDTFGSVVDNISYLLDNMSFPLVNLNSKCMWKIDVTKVFT